MLEYEYSFKVKSIEPFVNYCENNDYKKIGENEQTRILYKNSSKILARITTQNNGLKTSSVLDFKNENISDKALKVSGESIPLEITEKNESAIRSILDVLEYSKSKTLIRKRYVYEKEDVKFEIDTYTSPEIMCVIGIEGEKIEVDKVYKDICEKLIKHLV